MSIQTIIKSFTFERRAADQVSQQAQALCTAHDRLVWRQSMFNDCMQTLFKFLAPLSLLWLVASWWHGVVCFGDLVAFMVLAVVVALVKFINQ